MPAIRVFALLSRLLIILAASQTAVFAAPPDNDNFDQAATISANDGMIDGTNEDATAEEDEPNHLNRSLRTSVWYRWIAPSSGWISFSVQGEHLSAVIAVYEGSSLGTLSEVYSNFGGFSGYAATAYFAAVQGTSYYIAIDAYEASTAPFELFWTDDLPGNDLFANAEPLNGGIGITSGLVLNATAEPNEPRIYNNASSHTIWFEWTAPSDSPVSFSLLGSNFDTILGIYSGTTLENLVSVAESDDAVEGASIVSFRPTGGTVYRIMVGGYSQHAGTYKLTWINFRPANDHFADAFEMTGSAGTVVASTLNGSVELDEPIINTQATIWWRYTAPWSGPLTLSTEGGEIDPIVRVFTGDSISSLTEVADNTGPSGKPANKLTGDLTFETTAGTEYRIVVHGRFLERGLVRLTWSYPVPENDNYINRIPLLPSAGGQVSGSTLYGSVENNEPFAEDTTISSAWYNWTAETTGTVVLYTLNSSFDTILAAYTGTSLGTLAAAASNEDGGVDRNSLIRLDVVPGDSYAIQVGGYQDGVGAFNLHWTTTPASNDDFASAKAISGPSGQEVTDNYHSDREPGEPVIDPYTSTSLWWTWTAPFDATFTFATTYSNFDTILAVYTGETLDSLVLIAFNDDSGEVRTSRLSFVATAGQNYKIVVADYKNDHGNLSLDWHPGETAAHGAWSLYE